MSEFETEDQQLEAVKAWWKENGKVVIIGSVLGFGAIFGTKTYMGHLESQRLEASVAFEVMGQMQGQTEMVSAQGQQIVANYPDTPYAALASLTLAKQHVDKGELTAAQHRLQWVIDHAKQPDILHVARLRLARVLLADDQAVQAQTLLAHVDMESYTAIYQELRGDIYLAQQQMDQARLAYADALEALDERDDRQLLQMKLDDLGA